MPPDTSPGRLRSSVTSLLKRYLQPHRGVLVVIALLLLVQAFTNLYLPNLNADIINNGVVTGDVGYIVRVGGIMLAVSAVLVLASIVTVYFSARTSMRVGRDMRGDLFRRVESLSLSQVNALGVPSLITRNTNDVQQIQMLVMVGLTMMVLAPVTAVGAIIMAVRENAQLALLLIVIVPLMLVVISIMVVRAIPLFRAMQVKIDRVNQVMRENLTGIRVIRAFNQTDREINTRFDFKNTGTKIEKSGEKFLIEADTEERAKAALEVFRDKLVKRSVSLKHLDDSKPELSGKVYKISCAFKEGISTENAKKIAKLLRDEGPKSIKTQIQGDTLRVTSKSRDDLQDAIAMVKAGDWEFAVQFTNYR